MPTAEEEQLSAQLMRLSGVLDLRVPIVTQLDRYYDGDHPLPPLVQEARLTRAYRTLMDLAAANWPKLIVDSAEERMEVQGVRFGDADADKDVWELWQQNGLDAESSMLHQSTLTDGRGYAIVWTGDDGEPQITLEHASLCAVEYMPGTRRKRKAALRRWVEDKTWCATLYMPDGLYKFQAKNQDGEVPTEAGGWERREVPGEDWPLPNPLKEVPVVEFAVNRSLRPSPFGVAAGEYEANQRHIDRINYKLFSGLVALTWSGFPLRYMIGDPILRDDDNKPIKPFDALASDIVQLENPEAKLGQLPEANVDNYSPEMDIKHLAALTKTPANYLLGEMVNLSADAIRAAEAGLISKVRRHHRSLGESWEEVTKLALRVKDPNDPRGKDSQAQIIWADPESRSLAERGDALSKLKDILPEQALWELFGATPQEIDRWQAQKASDQLAALLAQPPAPVAPPATPKVGSPETAGGVSGQPTR